MEDISAEVKRALLDQELVLWRNTQYQIGVRLRVSRRIGDDTETQAGYIKQLERCERAIDALSDELAGVSAGQDGVLEPQPDNADSVSIPRRQRVP